MYSFFHPMISQLLNYWKEVYLKYSKAGADPGFSFGVGGGGGGTQKIMCAHGPMHIKSAKPKVPYRRGPGPGSSWVFYALSCYLILIFKHSHTKWDLKKQSRSNFSGSAVPIVPPSKSATAKLLLWHHNALSYTSYFSPGNCSNKVTWTWSQTKLCYKFEVTISITVGLQWPWEMLSEVSMKHGNASPAAALRSYKIEV